MHLIPTQNAWQYSITIREMNHSRKGTEAQGNMGLLTCVFLRVAGELSSLSAMLRSGSV